MMILFFQAILIALILLSLLVFIRVIIGPAITDRIISVNILGTKVSMIIVLLSFITGQDNYVSVALIFSMIAFVATLGISKYIDHGNLT
jgi:multicomponent Na+:H+ antiporter subunit F